MMRRQEALGEVVAQRSGGRHLAMSLGAGGSTSTLNNGRMFITLKPRDQRDARAGEVIARLRPKLEKVEGAKLFLQAAQDVNVGGRLARTQYQYTLQDANIDELNEWAPKMLAKLKTLPELRDVATDQQMPGTTLSLTIDRDQAVALRHHAAADRRHALRRLRPAPGRAVFHPAEQLSRGHGGPAGGAGRPGEPRQDLIKSPITGQQVPLSTFAKWTHARRSSRCRSATRASSRR